MCSHPYQVDTERENAEVGKETRSDLTLAAMDVEARQMNDVIIAASIRHRGGAAARVAGGGGGGPADTHTLLSHLIAHTHRVKRG